MNECYNKSQINKKEQKLVYKQSDSIFKVSLGKKYQNEIFRGRVEFKPHVSSKK